MSSFDINKEIISLSPSTLVEMFVIDSRDIDNNRLPISEQLIHIHNYVSPELTPIYFDGQMYAAVPCEWKGGELKGDGTQQPRPRFNITNHKGYASRIIRQANGMVGAKITRRRTFAKFLDEQTWPTQAPRWNTPDVNDFLAEDIFYVNKKVSETKDIVAFELVTALDLENVQLPRRKMFALSCGFQYRNGTGCGYDGPPVADYGDKSFTNATNHSFSPGYGFSLTNRGKWSPTATYNQGHYVYLEGTSYNEDSSALKRFYYVCKNNGIIGPNSRPSIDRSNWISDNCSRRIQGCLWRFDAAILRFGGFPALSRAGFSE